MVHTLQTVASQANSKGLFHLSAGIGSALFGGWTMFLEVFFILLTFDFITMLIRDLLKKELNPVNTLEKIAEYLLLFLAIGSFYQFGLMMEIGLVARRAALGIVNAHIFVSILQHLREVDVAPNAMTRLARALTEAE